MPSQETHALILAGPTASGKSAAAMELADRLGGAVICADSMQVYRDLRIVTARPSVEDEAMVPHRLYGHVDAGERYSAGRFVSDAKTAIEKAREEGQRPIICGGTGLYLKALTEGLSPVPDIPPESVVEAEIAFDEDPAAFRDRVLRSDPAMARLEPGDRQRHVRARAVMKATGKPLSYWQSLPKIPVLTRYKAAVLLPPRDTLYARCEGRFTGMLAEGAAEEVRALLARDLDPSLPIMRALGVPELASAIRGERSPDDAAALARQETRRFAKRQTTWFRNQTDWLTYQTADDLVRALQTGL